MTARLFSAKVPTDTTTADWEVRATYEHGTSDHFDARLGAVAWHFDIEEFEGGTVQIDRTNGDIVVQRQSGRRYEFRRKYFRSPITAAMVDNLVRLDRSAKDHMRIVSTKDGGVRLFGFMFGLSVPQSNAIRDKGWVHIADGKPALTSIGRWVIDHADDILDCLRRHMFLHVHQRQETAIGPRCSWCRTSLVAGDVSATARPDYRHEPEGLSALRSNEKGSTDAE